MANSSTTESAASIAPAKLEAWVRAALEAAGASTEAAAVTARVLVDANRRGLDSHGVVFLASYLKRLAAGSTKGDAHPETVVDLPGLTVIDGHDALGPYVAMLAMDACCAKAEQAGAGVALVRNSTHFGAASSYSEHAARRGCIGLALSNSDPGLAPLGSLGPLLGTNPLAIAAPAASGEPMPSLDIATSVVAQGKIILAERAGLPIPANWAIAPDGSPTTDASRALAGAVLPMGGHKGFGLAFMIDVLTACVAGGPPSPQVVGDPESLTPQGISHCFVAIHVASATTVDGYAERLAQLTASVHGAPHAASIEPFLVPGEPEARTAEDRRDLIPLTPATVQQLYEIAQQTGLTLQL